MSQNKSGKRNKRTFLKMYRRFIAGILYYLREQSPVQSIKYAEKFFRTKAKIEELEDRNSYLQQAIEKMEESVEENKCTVAEEDARLGSPWIDFCENIIKLSLGVVTVIVLFQIFGISVVNVAKSWQEQAILILVSCAVSMAIIWLTSSLIIGAIVYISETAWNKKCLVIPWKVDKKWTKVEFLSFARLFVLICFVVIWVEGISGGYLASQLIQSTENERTQIQIQENLKGKDGNSRLKQREEANNINEQLTKQSLGRIQNVKDNELKIQQFMAILASVNIAWSAIKGNKLRKTQDKRASRSASAKRARILERRIKKYSKTILRNNKEIEKLQKIIENYLADKDVEETYTGLSRQNTAGQDYTAKYPPMPDLDDFFNDEDYDFDEDDDFDEEIDEPITDTDGNSNTNDDPPDVELT